MLEFLSGKLQSWSHGVGFFGWVGGGGSSFLCVMLHAAMHCEGEWEMNIEVKQLQ